MLKALCPAALDVLCELYTGLLRNVPGRRDDSTVPVGWSELRVKLIPKLAQCQSLRDYRPITL
eukprot:2958221-Alexandrium_andersonii.AAC.1